MKYTKKEIKKKIKKSQAVNYATLYTYINDSGYTYELYQWRFGRRPSEFFENGDMSYMIGYTLKDMIDYIYAKELNY